MLLIYFFKGESSQWCQDMSPLVWWGFFVVILLFFPMHLQRHMSKSYSAQPLWILFWKQHKHRAWISLEREKYALAICAPGPAVYPGKAVRNLLLIWEQGAQASAKFLMEKWIKYCLVLVKEKHVALGGYPQYSSTNYQPLLPGNWLERGAHLEFQWLPVAATAFWEMLVLKIPCIGTKEVISWTLICLHLCFDESI